MDTNKNNSLTDQDPAKDLTCDWRDVASTERAKASKLNMGRCKIYHKEDDQL